jgi:glycerol-3-phosphate dehydrogenase (NAD(P)+)
MTNEEARASLGGVAEGAWTATVAVRLGQSLGVELPIAEQVARAVAGETTAAAAMDDLLARAPRPEDA